MRSTPTPHLLSIAVLLSTVLLLLPAGCSGNPKKEPITSHNDPSSLLDAGPQRTPVSVEGTLCREHPCMMHATTGRHHYCLNAGAGLCFQYGGQCIPAKQCMSDRKGTYRVCQQIRGGRCQSFGANCKPSHSCAFDPRSDRYRTCTAWSNGNCKSFAAPCIPE